MSVLCPAPCSQGALPPPFLLLFFFLLCLILLLPTTPIPSPHHSPLSLPPPPYPSPLPSLPLPLRLLFLLRFLFVNYSFSLAIIPSPSDGITRYLQPLFSIFFSPFNLVPDIIYTIINPHLIPVFTLNDLFVLLPSSPFPSSSPLHFPPP